MKTTTTCIATMLVMAACAELKAPARTVNDAARIACEAAFGQEQLPQGVSLEELCARQEDLQPFINHILAAKQTVGAAHGMAPEKE